MTKKYIIIIGILIVAVLAGAAVAVGLLGAEPDAKDPAPATQTEEAAGAGDSGTSDGDGESEEGDGPLATLFFASDFQKEPGFEAPATTLRGILGAMINDGKTPEQVVICGDYTNDLARCDHQLSPDDGIAEIKATVNGVLAASTAGGAEANNTGAGAGTACGSGETASEDEAAGGAAIPDDHMLFVQGNHDKMTDSISASGLHEYDDYLIYIVNTESDFPWKQGKKSGSKDKVQRTASDMKKCFDKLISDGETRPVFIAGHVPLHFTARTSAVHKNGDNLWAGVIFDVVNDAARNLDIIYMTGHNHSKGWDCYMGGSCIFAKAGDTILIPDANGAGVTTNKFREETLNFTYMNAGYLGYYANCSIDEVKAGTADRYAAADDTLTATAVEIYDNRIVVTRYDEEGVHPLGGAGEANPYKKDGKLISSDHYSKGTGSPYIATRWMR